MRIRQSLASYRLPALIPISFYGIIESRTLDGPAALSARESHKEVPVWVTPPSEVSIKGEPEHKMCYFCLRSCSFMKFLLRGSMLFRLVPPSFLLSPNTTPLYFCSVYDDATI